MCYASLNLVNAFIKNHISKGLQQVNDPEGHQGHWNCHYLINCISLPVSGLH